MEKLIEIWCEFSSCIIFVTIGTLLYFFTGRDSRIKKYVDQFDGPFSLPIIGSGFWFFRPNEEVVYLLYGWAKKYGPAYRMWMGTQANIVLSGASEIEKVLTSSINIEKSTDYQWFHKWLGFGLLTAGRDRWPKRRKLLTSAFHFQILETFVPIFNEQGNVMVEILKSKQGDAFDIFPYLTRCTLDIICETAMGTQINSQKGENSKYVKVIYSYTDILMKRFMRPWLQVSWIWKMLGYEKIENEYVKALHTFTEEVITARKKEHKNQMKDNATGKSDNNIDYAMPKKRKAFLDLLLDAADKDKSLTDLEIREETSTFMFEGHDTTAANLAWTIFMLSLYPEHQRKVQQELYEIFGSDRSRDITTADISRMKYLECCIKETLRLYPSVAFFIRHLSQDVDLGGNRLMPKGTNIYIGPYAVHRDPIAFPEPEIFNPERFFLENCEHRHPFVYIPFSAGARNCIGQKFAILEEKIILAKLFMNFSIESVKTREEVKVLPDIVARPFGGMHVNISARPQ